MKTLILATTLIASIIAGTLAVQAAPNTQPKSGQIDGYKLFDDIANRSGG